METNTNIELKHQWRIVECQVFYRKYGKKLCPCRPTTESEDQIFDYKEEAEIYLKKYRAVDYWKKVNQENGNAYYEIINDRTAILHYRNSVNFRIITFSVVDFYEDLNNLFYEKR